MNLVYFIIIVLFLGGNQSFTGKAGSGSSDINWISLTEAQQKTKIDGKPLFVFVEAEWCGICKRMMNSVFPLPDITELLVENYHPVLIDLDSGEIIIFNGEEISERNFARNMQVQQTPTMIFIDSAGDVMGRQPGFMGHDELERLLHYVLSDQFGTVPLTEFRIH